MQDLTQLFDLSNPIAGVYPIDRVGATDAAYFLLEELRAQYGPLCIHHTGGCFDGSDPLCLPKGELKLAARDIPMGDLDGTAVYIDVKFQEAWQDRQFILDAVPGMGTGFGLDSGTGRRFLARSRVFSDAERAAIAEMFP